MFKNAFIFRLGDDWSMATPDICAELEKHTFQPIGATQTESNGWVPVRGIENGYLAESQGCHQVVRMRSETKGVPSQILDKRVSKLAKEFEEQTGRKAGKKIRKELKATALDELLPVAFPKAHDYYVWIDNLARLIIVDAASESKDGDVVSLLIKSLPDLVVSHYATATSPERCMAAWLMDGVPPHGFSIDREVDLQSYDEFRSTANYKRCNLDTEEIRDHIRQGKVPVKLAMTWRDRVSFLFTDTYQIKRIEFLDVVMNAHASSMDNASDAWDADLAIATGELGPLIADITFALGGLVAPDLFTPSTPMDPAAQSGPQMELDAGPSDSDLLASMAGDDPMYEQARVLITMGQCKASISQLQRLLRIGYNRAARLLEELEVAGIVSPMATDGTRTVLETV